MLEYRVSRSQSYFQLKSPKLTVQYNYYANDDHDKL